MQNLQTIYEVLKWVFTLFPQFCLGQGLIELCYNQIQFDLTHSLGVDTYASPFRMSFLGWAFVLLASQGTALLLLRLLLHGDAVRRARYARCPSGANVEQRGDSVPEAAGRDGTASAPHSLMRGLMFLLVWGRASHGHEEGQCEALFPDLLVPGGSWSVHSPSALMWHLRCPWTGGC